ncbi:thiol-disulfide oxidoreductase DCC family protein [Bacteriovorax sp. Seq25_V]|uniref:thiol-disulfide oxidoreductase DCC family protein n=1 Tax=Bacteriovorax sp. Seq25_V TaxID=1201288 RepID=UPI00038A0DD5|nr:DCC1-like thiol-disulfide oxidoreductase family protein [Bacteriovorax sp. Seq25_V]EQC45588.1 PF04134 family protein [Bacteriovorax sp. Seq25_V]
MRILFIDGDCLLCQEIVRIVFFLDKKAVFSFAPLQGQHAKVKLPAQLIADLDTVVLYKDGNILTKSDAAIEVLCELGAIYRMAKIFYIIPKFIRDALYMLVSRNRKKIFKRETCLYSPELQKRFLN